MTSRCIKNVRRKILCVLIPICILFVLFSSLDTSVSAAESSSPTNNAYYYIRNYYTGRYLTVDGTTSGSNVCQNIFTGQSNQKFKLSSASSGYYYIINNANLYLDINNMSTNNGTNVKVFYKNDAYTNAQQYKFSKNSDGTYRIIPKCCASSSPNEVLEVVNGSTDDNTNVQIWDWKGIKHQEWILEKASTTVPGDMCWQLPFNDTIANGSILVTNTADHPYHDLDFDVAYGTAIYCTAPATVTQVGYEKTMGNYVIVQYDRKYTNSSGSEKTLTSRYLHMKEYPAVKLGQYVTHFTLMGYVGNTGSVIPQPSSNNPTAGTHLHLDVNTEGKTAGSQMNTTNTIQPELFFPNANFVWY